jgi:ferredoxin
MPEKQLKAREGAFDEVALGLSESQVISETERCLQCGICSECLLCLESCRDIGAIVHGEDAEEIIEHAGVVIIADPEAAPFVRGEDVIRAYGPKAARSDVPAMITRGFAAAALASILVGGASQRPKGHGLAFSPPDPELSPDIRMGVFACRCNDSFGWTDEMDAYVHGLTERKDIIYSEVMVSACVPEGASSILKTIREKGLTRVVLATCVCCPLDFICSACTDQRTRLKDTLFRGTGISRSMVETCNLRGEALRTLRHDEKKAVERFTGLIDRSIQRAFNLKPLPAPARNYNFTTAVIGESEASINSAVTLAQTGLEVFHLGGPDKPLTKSPRHDNIHCFAGSAVKGMSGTLGNFQVFIEIDGVSQVLDVGAVIIGDKQRRHVPYIPQRGLPNRRVTSSMQKPDLPGIPYLLPGATPIAGLFLANPKGINVSQRKKGLAAAMLAAAIMPRGPRQNKGYTVSVKKDNCRGCGRCLKACPYQAVSLKRNSVGGWYALVDEALCKGCGNCISVCPSNAADSPYRDHGFLEHMLEEVLM